MRIKTFLLIAALGLPAIAAADDTKSKPTEKGRPTEQAKLSSADQAIIAHVHHVNLMELDLGKLAEKHGVKVIGEEELDKLLGGPA
ncbi:MAG TPA: hypothetical protein VN253_00325 [Kofleriaceae bacterium]|nr:hypothetical protein [Kofleriaceae bacterium]